MGLTAQALGDLVRRIFAVGIDAKGWERSYDCIHTALHKALTEAGIELPCPSQSLNVQVDGQTPAEVWQAWQGEGGEHKRLKP